MEPKWKLIIDPIEISHKSHDIVDLKTRTPGKYHPIGCQKSKTMKMRDNNVGLNLKLLGDISCEKLEIL